MRYFILNSYALTYTTHANVPVELEGRQEKHPFDLGYPYVQNIHILLLLRAFAVVRIM